MVFSHIFEPVPLRDWIILATLFAGIFILISISEFIRMKLEWPQEFTRKLVHILVGLMMFFIPILLQTSLPMVLIAAFFTLTNLIALRKGWLKGMHGARESYGTAFYPLSFLILVLLCWPDNVVIIIASMMVLALGDAMAAIVGESIERPHSYLLIEDRKSWEGTITMFLVSAGVLFCILQFYPFPGVSNIDSPTTALWFSIITAIFTTAAEALSRKGSDNLSVPLSAALILYYLLNHSFDENIRFTVGLCLGGLAAILSYRLGFLSASGAVATFLLAAIIFGFGGWQWTVPILTFFVLSSLLSKVGKRIKSKYDLVFEKGSRRDYAQVIANGGMAGIFMIVFMIFKKPEIYYLYLGALAAATADTWATEIGTLAKQEPRLITSFRKVAAGTSGGITNAGLLSASLGAFLIGLSGWLFFQNTLESSAGTTILLIAFSGLFGSLIDSLLGATLQVQYRCPDCNRITERNSHCNENATLAISGKNWMNNDMVNFISTGAAALILGIYFYFTG